MLVNITASAARSSRKLSGCRVTQINLSQQTSRRKLMKTRLEKLAYGDIKKSAI